MTDLNVPAILDAFKTFSPAMAAMVILGILIWRQHSSIKGAMTTLKETLKNNTSTFVELFATQNKTQSDAAEKFAQSAASFTNSLIESTKSVSDLNGKLSSMPILMEQMIEQKLSMRPDVGSAILKRIENIENKQFIQDENFKKFIQALKDRQDKK